MNRRAEGNGFVGVLRGVQHRASALVEAVAEAEAAAFLLELRASEPLTDEAAHERHARLPADEDDLVELFCFELRVAERAEAMLASALDDVAGEAFQLLARELVAEAEIRREEREDNLSLGLGREANLRGLGSFAKAGEEGGLKG